MRWSRMTRAASTTVASGPTQMGGPRTSRSASAERSGWKAATGDCSRLARSRSPSPAAKWAAKRGSSSSRRKTAAGSSQATRSSSTTTSSVALPVMRDV